MRKEKLLVTSCFFFSHNVFNSYISLVRQNALLCVNGLTAHWQPKVNNLDVDDNQLLFCLSKCELLFC